MFFLDKHSTAFCDNTVVPSIYLTGLLNPLGYSSQVWRQWGPNSTKFLPVSWKSMSGWRKEVQVSAPLEKWTAQIPSLHFLPFGLGAYLLASYHLYNSKPGKGTFRKHRKGVKAPNRRSGVKKLQCIRSLVIWPWLNAKMEKKPHLWVQIKAVKRKQRQCTEAQESQKIYSLLPISKWCPATSQDTGL